MRCAKGLGRHLSGVHYFTSLRLATSLQNPHKTSRGSQLKEPSTFKFGSRSPHLQILLSPMIGHRWLDFQVRKNAITDAAKHVGAADESIVR
jgi:hypothetical protein